ncbi:hypothetical protein [Mesorhizobium captivum]|uniref:hypothetical protein n=1 Tax=Mesorhizobium captivum TaxID=3072319 RepID=UPI002A24B4CC|nr:hypothetical protein [Mesorhizobium sp. VK3C]MDX8450480.1 hypothetical protein [Mesorhizobium sp. VK3C]
MAVEPEGADPTLFGAASRVRDLYPGLVSLFACGSYVNRRGPLVSDIDFIALSMDHRVALASDISFVLGRFDVNVTVYSPAYFPAIAARSDLFFYNLRDVRKILSGRLLYDRDDIGARIVALLRSTEVDSNVVRGLYQSAKQSWSGGPTPERFTFACNRAIDLLTFALMHSRRDIAYSKHKYLLEDARAIPGDLFALLSDMADATVCAVDLRKAATALLDRTDLGAVKAVVNDADRLLRAGRVRDAVFPLRYVCLTVLLAASTDATGDLDLLASLLLLGAPIPQRIRLLYRRCLDSALMPDGHC